MRLTVLAAMLAAACLDDPHALAPPVVDEPTDGLTTHSCLTRVRTDLPGDDWSPGSGWGVEFGRTSHMNWRTNGGRIHEADTPTFDSRVDEPYQFAVTLESGANSLEIGRCDAVDYCAWKTVDVNVVQGPGDPDCTFGGGLRLLRDFVLARAVHPHPDGWVLVEAVPGGEAGGLVKFDAEGKRVSQFGTDGLARPGEYVFGSLTAPDGNGFLVLTTQGNGHQLLSRLADDGTLDATLGTGGVAEVPTGDATSFIVLDLRAWTDGTFLLAGLATRDASTKPQPFLLALDASLHVSVSRFLGTGAPVDLGLRPFTDARIDADGTAWFLVDGTVVAGSLTADRTDFGVEGVFALDASDGAPAGFGAGGGTVAIGLRQYLQDGSARFRLRTVTGSSTALVELPGAPGDPYGNDRAVQVAVDDAGTAFAAYAVRTNPRSIWGWTQPLADGSGFQVARVKGGALDTAFGAGGTTLVRFEDAHLPVAVDATTDVPNALALDDAGRLLVVGTTRAPTGAWTPPYGTAGVGLVRLLP